MKKRALSHILAQALRAIARRLDRIDDRLDNGNQAVLEELGAIRRLLEGDARRASH